MLPETRVRQERFTKQKSLPIASINAQTMDNDFVICCNLFIIIGTISLRVLIKVYAGIPTPHRPVYVEVYSPPGITDDYCMCSRRPSHKRSTISPACLSGTGTKLFSRPSWVIILTQHSESFFQISIQLLDLHFSIHQSTNVITVTFTLQVNAP